MEAGVATPEEWRELMPRQAGFSYEADTQAYCLITVPAPWRDTPGPTELVERPPAPVAQQKLEFS